MNTLRSDVDSLAKIKEAHAQKFKFSSECLEIVLRKNFFQSSEYLINEYYPKTSIDTELIVKNIGNEVKRNQDYLLFQLKKRETKGVFPKVQPVIYWA